MEAQHPLWGWHKKAYYGKIKCNLKHPWFQGLLTQTHRDWCVYPIMDTHTYACFALHPFVPNAHVCKCTEMHTWPTTRHSVFFLLLALFLRYCHLQTRHWLTKNCYVNHKITFNSYSLQLLGNSIPSSNKRIPVIELNSIFFSFILACKKKRKSSECDVVKWIIS